MNYAFFNERSNRLVSKCFPLISAEKVGDERGFFPQITTDKNHRFPLILIQSLCKSVGNRLFDNLRLSAKRIRENLRGNQKKPISRSAFTNSTTSA